MLYLVYVLTFLAGILFYMLSPRDDQVNLDAYRAEGFIVSFLAQHQAAKDYMTQWLGFKLNQPSFNLTEANFMNFFPLGVTAEISQYQNNTSPAYFQKISTNDDWHYQTSVFCFDSSDILVQCDDSSVTGRYLVTYSGNPNLKISPGKYNRPTWWPAAESNRQRRYGAWRNALTRRTSGSYNCGVLTNEGTPGSTWCVDNGQTVLTKTGQCAQKVPKAICDTLGCAIDAFFCISRVKQGPEKYYVPGLSAFYDGINNNNTGAEGTRDTADVWIDLITQTNIATNANFAVDTEKMASKNSVSFPINLVSASGAKEALFRPFTLTLLLQSNTDPNANTDEITFLELGSNQVSFQLDKQDTSCKLKITGPKLTEEIEGDVPCNFNRILPITVIGNTDELSIYVGTQEITTLPSSDITPNFSNLQTTKIEPKFNSDGGYVYGVRYYANKALTTESEVKDKRIPSELEQNLKMDSKRYGFSYQ